MAWHCTQVSWLVRGYISLAKHPRPWLTESILSRFPLQCIIGIKLPLFYDIYTFGITLPQRHQPTNCTASKSETTAIHTLLSGHIEERNDRAHRRTVAGMAASLWAIANVNARIIIYHNVCPSPSQKGADTEIFSGHSTTLTDPHSTPKRVLR